MSNDYSGSFLICFRGEVTELYISGIPIAQIRGDEIKYIYPKDTDGNERLIEFDKIPNCPFKGTEEFIAAVEGVVGKLRRFGMSNVQDEPRR